MYKYAHRMSFLLALAVGVMPCAFAEGRDSEQGILMPHFKFQAQAMGTLSNGPTNSPISSQNLLLSGPIQSLQQYDATMYYPFGDSVLNFDLGLNLRYMDGYLSSAMARDNNRSLDETIPMLYANALFNLPFKGLSASVGGKHLIDLHDHSLFDYSAKLGYRWESGFGLQGGWKHQQYNLDTGTATSFERKGLFLDMDYHF